MDNEYEENIQNSIDNLARRVSELRLYADRPLLAHEFCDMADAIVSGMYYINELRERDTRVLEAAWATVVSSPESKKLFDYYYAEVKKRGGTGVKFEKSE